MPDRTRISLPSDGKPNGATATEHTHQLPKVVSRALVGLVIATLLLCALGAFLAVYVWQFNEYVQGRGVYRDQEADRLEQRIDDAICDLLESLPASALLDRVRGDYGCGPGIPVEEFPPEVQREINGGAAPSVAPARPSPAPPPPPVGSGGALPGVTPGPTETYRPDPTPAPVDPGPVVDLSPVIESADDLLCPLICLTEETS